ncbi:hypothetical protein [Blautia marasmi]|uniref:hypothetical protein n=1 Tax=Blautia marasmi TaxID=1917868 RepID=UPI0025978F77|nr:hypothetical protein [uncultured Blautia sp.]
MTDLFARDIYLPSPRKLSDTWAEETLQDLEDFIEEQGGGYIRQQQKKEFAGTH